MSEPIAIERCPVCGTAGHIHMKIDHKAQWLMFDHGGKLIDFAATMFTDDDALSAIECTECDTWWGTLGELFEEYKKAYLADA